MALFTPATPQGIADLPVHIRNTYIREALRAEQTRKSWALAIPEPPYRAETGQSVSVAVEGALAVTTAVLAADSDGTPLQTSEAAALIPCYRYGHYVLLTQEAVEQKDLNTIDSKMAALVEHAYDKDDLICGTALLAGSNVAFKNGRADATFLVGGDTISSVDFIAAGAHLGDNLSPRYDDGTYRAFLPNCQIADLFSDASNAVAFVEQAKYANPEALITAEVGRFHGFTIVRTGRLSVVELSAGAGGNTADLVRTLFTGKRFGGHSERQALTVVGPYPAGDIMGQVQAMRYRFSKGYGRIREANALRKNYRSAFATNP